MTDERDTPDGQEDGGPEDDGLDAWLAANFPPKTPDAAPPEPVQPPVTPPAQPTTPPVPPLVEPPPATPTSDSPASGLPWLSEPTAVIPPVPEPPPPLSSELPPLFPPSRPASPPHPGGEQAEPPAVPPVADELPGLPPEPDVPADPTEILGGFGDDSALDALFGESKFRDYEAEPAPSENPFAVRTVVVDTAVEGGPAASAPGISPSQKVLMWVAGSLVAVLALVALFLVGTRLPELLGPAPAVVMSPTITPTPTATALPLGPVDPGVYRWDELLGGECLDPYDGPWDEEFTVVDCAGSHPAQLATRGTFGADDGLLTPYPGIEALESQLNLLCTAPTVVDYAKANAYTDIQFEASFAVTSDDWVAGHRDYYCFLSRSSGGQLEGSIAMPQVAPTPTETPAP